MILQSRNKTFDPLGRHFYRYITALFTQNFVECCLVLTEQEKFKHIALQLLLSFA